MQNLFTLAMLCLLASCLGGSGGGGGKKSTPSSNNKDPEIKPITPDPEVPPSPSTSSTHLIPTPLSSDSQPDDFFLDFEEEVMDIKNKFILTAKTHNTGSDLESSIHMYNQDGQELWKIMENTTRYFPQSDLYYDFADSGTVIFARAMETFMGARFHLISNFNSLTNEDEETTQWFTNQMPGTLLYSFPRPETSPYEYTAMTISGDGSRFALATDDVIYFDDLGNIPALKRDFNNIKKIILPTGTKVRSLDYDYKGNTLAVQSRKGIQIFNMNTSTLIQELPFENLIDDIAISHNGKVVVANDFHHLIIMNEQEVTVKNLLGVATPDYFMVINNLVLSSDGSTLAFSHFERDEEGEDHYSIRSMDTQTAELKWWTPGTYSNNKLKISEEGRYVFALESAPFGNFPSGKADWILDEAYVTETGGRNRPFHTRFYTRDMFTNVATSDLSMWATNMNGEDDLLETKIRHDLPAGMVTRIDHMLDVPVYTDGMPMNFEVFISNPGKLKNLKVRAKAFLPQVQMWETIRYDAQNPADYGILDDFLDSTTMLLNETLLPTTEFEQKMSLHLDVSKTIDLSDDWLGDVLGWMIGKIQSGVGASSLVTKSLNAIKKAVPNVVYEGAKEYIKDNIYPTLNNKGETTNVPSGVFPMLGAVVIKLEDENGNIVDHHVHYFIYLAGF